MAQVYTNAFHSSWQGSLWDLTGIIFAIRSSQESGRLTLRNSDRIRVAHLYFHSGKLVHIVGSSGNAEATLRDLQLWTRATVRFERGSTATGAAITAEQEQSFEALLLSYQKMGLTANMAILPTQSPPRSPTLPVAPTPDVPMFSPPLDVPASPPPPETLPLSEQESLRRRRFSRRGTALGLIALGVITVGGGGVIIGKVLQSQSSVLPSVPNPHPSSISLGKLVHMYAGHSAPVRSVVWSPDGKSLASGSEDKTVRIWDVGTGRLLRNYQGHADVVLTVAWSPNGQSVASGGQDDTTQVWNVHTGQLLSMNRNYTDHIHTVAWSPDGQYLASGSDDHSVQVWNVKTAVVTPQTLRFDNTLHTAPVEWVAWSPKDGKLLATSSDDGTVKILESGTGALVYNYTSSPNLPSGLRWVLSVLWSPDGKRIASAGRDGLVQVWEASTGTVVFVYKGNAGWVERIAWSPDGEYIAAAYDNHVVQIIDARRGTLHFTYRGHLSQVYTVAWSPDGRYIASAGADKSVQVWTAG